MRSTRAILARFGQVEVTWDTDEVVLPGIEGFLAVVGTAEHTRSALVVSPKISGDLHSGNTKTIDITGSLVGRIAHFVATRIVDVVSHYSDGVPMVTASYLPTLSGNDNTIDVGTLVEITRTDMPVPGTGELGMTTARGIVTERGETIDGRVQGLRFLLYDWHNNDGTSPATWGATGTVASYSSPTITINANDWTDSGSGIDDIDAFNYGTDFDIYVTDVNGLLIASGQGTVDHTTVNIAAGTMDWDGSATPVAGQLVILAPYDQQTAAFKALVYSSTVGMPSAFLAGDDGTLGAATDAGEVWL